MNCLLGISMSSSIGRAKVLFFLMILQVFSAEICFAEGQGNKSNAGKPVPGSSFTAYEVSLPGGRSTTYYLSRAKDVDAPLLVMIQGSGCDAVINVQGDSSYSTIFNLFIYAQEQQFSVMAVEKPYAGVVQNEGQRGCSSKFYDDFSAESWLSALSGGIEDARKKLGGKAKRTLVMGASEGATMAALLASHEEKISDVILIGASGTTQIFDFIARDYDKCFDVSKCLGVLDDELSEIYLDPLSTNKFKWGHTHKRWSSFFKVDPSNELLKSDARLYLVFGTADDATPPISQEIIYAKMKAAGKDITVRRVADAGHGLMGPYDQTMDGLDRELRSALNWFWKKP